MLLQICVDTRLLLLLQGIGDKPPGHQAPLLYGTLQGAIKSN